jgi:N-acetylmuramoyl-L-alanine amidase
LREAGVQSEASSVESKPIRSKPVGLNPDLIFKVQIAASKNRIAAKGYNFKGLSPISREKSGKLYRYFYQSSISYEEAKQHLKIAKNKGYTNAFVVAYNGDKKISISEALELIK